MIRLIRVIVLGFYCKLIRLLSKWSILSNRSSPNLGARLPRVIVVGLARWLEMGCLRVSFCYVITSSCFQCRIRYFHLAMINSSLITPFSKPSNSKWTRTWDTWHRMCGIYLPGFNDFSIILILFYFPILH